MIEDTPAVTANTLAKTLNISERAVNKNLATLKELGIIERIGADKNGYWKIIKSLNS
jgi:predicted HTH transcriptional regulator